MKRGISTNNLLVLQQLVTAGVFFLLYKIYLDNNPKNIFGFWVLINSFVIALKFLDFSPAAAVVRLLRKSERKEWSKIYMTALSINIGVTVIVGLASHTILELQTFEISEIDLAETTVNMFKVIAIVSLPLGVISTFQTYILDGLDQIRSRTILIITSNLSSLVFMIICVNLAPELSLGLTLLFQNIVNLFVSTVIVSYKIKLGLSFFPLKEIIIFSIKNMVASWISILVEPILKITIGKQFDLNVLANYELISKFALQVRNISNSSYPIFVVEYASVTDERDRKNLIDKKILEIAKSLSKMSPLFLVLAIVFGWIYKLDVLNLVSLIILTFSWVIQTKYNAYYHALKIDMRFRYVYLAHLAHFIPVLLLSTTLLTELSLFVVLGSSVLISGFILKFGFYRE